MELEKLTKAIIDQAKYFLTNAGEFYPFGAVINKKDEIVPLGVQLENDHPQPREVIEVLEKAILEKLTTGEAKLGGIGTDVDYKPIGENEKRSAIQIRTLQANGRSIDYYLPYRNENGTFIFEDVFDDRGTLNFLRVV